MALASVKCVTFFSMDYSLFIKTLRNLTLGFTGHAWVDISLRLPAVPRSRSAALPDESEKQIRGKWPRETLGKPCGMPFATARTMNYYSPWRRPTSRLLSGLGRKLLRRRVYALAESQIAIMSSSALMRLGIRRGSRQPVTSISSDYARANCSGGRTGCAALPIIHHSIR